MGLNSLINACSNQYLNTAKQVARKIEISFTIPLFCLSTVRPDRANTTLGSGLHDPLITVVNLFSVLTCVNNNKMLELVYFQLLSES